MKEKLRDEEFDVIISSPLKRALETAQIIRSKKDIEIILDDRLMERDYGEFEGSIKSEFDYNSFWAYEKNLHYERAENIREFFNRVKEFLETLKEKYANKKVLIVTHGGVVKAIECITNGLMTDEEIASFLPNNASILEYEI